MTKLEEFIAQLHEISNGIADIRERLARMEEKVNSLSSRAEDGKKKDEDHERRIRSLEMSKAGAIGWAAGAGTVAGGIVSALWKKFFG